MRLSVGFYRTVMICCVIFFSITCNYACSHKDTAEDGS